jgi:UDP-N-acetylglucosamine/UDP-N-acetylgalactosamine diphosphorylase
MYAINVSHDFLLVFFLWLYPALKSKRLLDDMAAKGVNYVDCYGVDNVLVNTFFMLFISWSLPFFVVIKYLIYLIQVRVADPTFLGYFIDRGVSAAAKVVRKVGP